jgi:integrase/recombinase XerC
MSYYKEREKKNTLKINEMLDNLPDFIRRYIYSIQNSTTTLSQIGYLTDISAFFGYIFDKPAKTVTTDDLGTLKRDDFYGYLNYIRAYEKDGVCITNGDASLKRKLSSLRGLWAYLYNEDLISENVLSKVNVPKLRKKETVRLDADEKAELLGRIENGNLGTERKEIYHKKLKQRDLAVTALLLSTGMRVSELVGLNLEDINLEKSSARITRKGNKADVVYFSDEASVYLSEYLEERQKIKCETPALFLSMRKQRIAVRTVETVIKDYAKAVTLKHITPHKLRATYGSELYEETGDIYLVAQSLGHNSTDTTSKHYISTTDKKKSKTRNMVKLKGERQE